MLYIDAQIKHTTTEVTIQNKLLYLVVIENIDRPNMKRILEDYINELKDMIPTNDSERESVDLYVHTLWWEPFRIGALFVTSDILFIQDKFCTVLDFVQLLYNCAHRILTNKPNENNSAVGVNFCSICYGYVNYCHIPVDNEQGVPCEPNFTVTVDEETNVVEVVPREESAEENAEGMKLCCCFLEYWRIQHEMM